MADLSNSSWSETDSNNSQPSPDGFPSGILPSQVGGAIRAMRGAVKRSYDRSNAMIVSGGSTADNTYTLTYEQPPTGYVKGEVYRFFANFTNTAAALVNINGLGNKNLNRADGAALSGGELVAGQVVTAIYDGAIFLHQSTGTRNFKDNVSIQNNSDAILTIESLAAPNTTFRAKKIYSSVNVNGGNDWLFRQVRPSDGAVEDWLLKTGTSGTIWTTGNFNPDSRVAVAGGSTITGQTNVGASVPLKFNSIAADINDGKIGTRLFEKGLNIVGAATEAGSTQRYLTMYGHSLTYGNISSTGHVYAAGGDMHAHRGNASGYYFTGNADQAYYGHDGSNYVMRGPGTLYVNDIEVSRQSQYHVASGYGLVNGENYIYTDANSAYNLVLRTGSSAAGYKYTSIDKNGLLTSAGSIRGNGDVIATGRVVVGEGQNFSYIEMRDADEGTRYVHHNSGNIGFLGKDAGWKFYVRDDGTVWTAQFGDLNSRIEARGQAWGEWGRNQCATSMRLPYAGDLYNSWNLNGGMAEPYGGSMMSSRATVADGTANGAWIPGIFRWRYVQYYTPNSGWVTAYYA